MSRKYKFGDQNKLHFISFSCVHWIDVFIRNIYKHELLKSIEHCCENKGLEVYGWCIMTSHVHMIIGTHGDKMEHIMRDFKRHTSTKMKDLLADNVDESRKDWLVWMMQRAGRKNGHNNDWQFWQQDNHPIEIISHEMFDQKLNYIHQNPVEAGFVTKAEDWLYSSAIDYAGGQGLLKIIVI